MFLIHVKNLYCKPFWNHYLSNCLGTTKRFPILRECTINMKKVIKALFFDLLRNNYKPISELRSAVIWTKGLSTFTPDYAVEFLPTNPWIHQPFESYDALGPEKLLEKWKV